MEEMRLLKKLQGNTGFARKPKLDGLEYEEAILVLGGKSGKTTLAGAIACYEACCTDWKQFLREGELAWIFVIATKEKQAIDLGRNIIFQNIHRSPFLKSLIVEAPTLQQKTQFPYTKTNVMVLKTGAAITALPCSSRVGRGYNIACLIMDEVAYFARESNEAISDREIYASILPRQIQFGNHAKRILISTPADKTGLLWEKYRDREKNTDLYCAFRAPTWIIRSDIPRDEFKKYRRLSPLTFDQEYGAEFGESLKPFVPEKDILLVCRENDEWLPADEKISYVMSIDAAFGERDRFVVGVAHAEEIPGQERRKVIIDGLECIEATYAQDVHDRAVERLEELYKAYNIFEIRADQYQADAFQKTLEARGMNFSEDAWTAAKHRSKYGRLRAAIKQKLITLPNNEEMLQEFRHLQVKYLSSGQFTIDHMRGGHDDFCDVLADLNDQLYEDELASVGIDFN